MSLHLGLDVGTQSVKAVLLDPELGIVASGQAPLALVPGLPPGHSEEHPADWIAGVQCATAAALAQLPGAGERVVSLAVSGQQHGMVPLDERHAVLRPAKLWNDVSSAPQCAAITRELGGPAKVFAALGNRLAPGFTAGKVRWLREVEPHHFARLRMVLLPHEYVNLWLTGDATAEFGDASGTGWFDVRTRSVAKAVCAKIAPGLHEMLPRLLAHGEPAGRLRPEAARALGLREGLVVGAGSGDNMMAALGLGAVEPGVLVASLGTSGTVFAVSERPVCDAEGEIAAFCSASGHWLPLGCTMNATVTTEITRRLFGAALDELEALAATVPAGAQGVLCLPFFTGERSPDLPLGSGAFLGVTPQNGKPANFMRASYEGATFALVRLVDRLRALGTRTHEVRLTGGGARSALWQRIFASALGEPVHVCADLEAAALGAAIQGLWTLRRERETSLEVGDVVRELPLAASRTLVTPEPEWTSIYRDRRLAYEESVSALTPVFPRLRT